MLKRNISLYFLILCLSFSNIFAATTKNKQNGYIAVDGGKIYYEKFGAKNSNPVIVLHGGPGMLDSSYLLPQMAELANENQVIFYDQRGSGKSLGFALNSSSINMNNFVADLEALRAKLGFDKFTVVGHSWGGLLAMAYAIKYPQHLNAVVLVSSAPANAAGFKIFGNEYVKRTQTIQSELTKIETSKQFQDGDPSAVKQYFHDIFAVYFYNKADLEKLSLVFTKPAFLSGKQVADILMIDYLSTYDLSAELNKLQMPVLIIHGENDIVPLSTAQTTNALIPNSQLIVLQDCDHFPYIEKPSAFFNDTSAFINAHKPE